MTRPLTILFVHYEWPGVTDCGGSGRVAAGLRDRLEMRGHDCPLVTDPDDGHYTTFALRRRAAIKRALRDHEPDVVFAGSTLPTAVGLGSLCETHDTPLVVKTMGSDVVNPERFQRIRPLLDVLNRRVFASADRIICQSQTMADHVPERDQERVAVIPNGLATDDWTWRRRDRHDPLRVLTVARIEPVKRIATGIRAVACLRAQGTPATYRIVGDGSDLPALREAFGDIDWVEFTGWSDAVRDHYRWGDVFLLPSAHESFGMVLLEALASGLPCVTTDTGGQSEVVETRVGAVTGPPQSALAAGLDDVAATYRRRQRATDGYVSSRYELADVVDAYERELRQVAGVATPSVARTSAD